MKKNSGILATAENRAFQIEELISKGIFPNVDTYYGFPWPDIPKLNTPISPKKNLKLFLNRKECCWIPSLINDINWIYPDIVPDCFACKMEGGIDSFGVEWVQTHPELFLPSFVKPGNPKLKNIKDWETLELPDVESWNWIESSIKFKEGLDDDRINIGVMLSGFFERLIALMDFQYAAIALVKYPESVKALFDKIADYNISLMEHYVKYHHIEMVILHDDWAAQRSPFFRKKTLQTVILPYYKRVTDRAHELGLTFIGHCCGNAESFVPDMIETGIDIWQLQIDANPNILETIEKYGDSIMFDIYFKVPSQTSLEDFRIIAEEKFNTYLAGKNVTYAFGDENFVIYPEWVSIGYEFARKTAIK